MRAPVALRRASAMSIVGPSGFDQSIGTARLPQSTGSSWTGHGFQSMALARDCGSLFKPAYTGVVPTVTAAAKTATAVPILACRLMP
jgi:hypothetical protein